MKKLYPLTLAFLLLSAFAFSAPQQDTSVHLMRMNLYGLNTDGSIFRLDGAFAQYADNYSDAIDGMDGRKMTNPGINVCLLRNNINLVVERRHTITADDTLFFNIWGLQKTTYLLKFVGENLNQPGLNAFLEDSYLHTSQPVKLDDTTDIKIDINNDPGSATNNRFRLVFKIASVAPVLHFTSIGGEQILLNWNGRNTDSVQKYWIQRSSNGADFTDIGALTAPLTSENLEWADPFPTEGFNYYRIKSLQNNGQIAISNIVISKSSQTIRKGIILYPNPAKADNMNLKMENQPSGRYLVKMFNSFGQPVMQSAFDFAGGAGVQKINNNSSLVPGVYHLQIVKPNGDTQSLDAVF